MGKGCDPELRLRLGSSEEYSSANDEVVDESDPIKSNRVVEWFRNTTAQQQQEQQEQQQQQQITIFYNGRMCVCDVTEIQARAIIWMASREMEERAEKSKKHQKRPSSPRASALASHLINPDISMKRSLQRFLEKRKKTRMDASMPYSYAPESRTPSPSS